MLLLERLEEQECQTQPWLSAAEMPQEAVQHEFDSKEDELIKTLMENNEGG